MKKPAQRWMFGGAAVAYAAVVLSLLPWATEPGYETPYLIAIYGVSICAADVCTTLFLLRQYRLEGQTWLLALSAAFLFSACLALPVALSFPDAFGAGQVVGHETTSTILYLSWRVGAAVLLLSAVLLGVKSPRRTEPKARAAWMVAVCAATALVAAGFIVAALEWHIAPMSEGRFTLSSFVSGWLVVSLSLATVVVIFVTRSQARPIFGWLALMCTATMADMMMSTLGGARFSLGWYLSRCSNVVVSYLLLAYLAAEFARGLKNRPAAAELYSYIGAVALAICAALLRYFLLPWAGTGLTYTTLYGAVAVAVWMGGWRPAALTALLGMVLAHLIVREPFGTFAFYGLGDLIGVMLFTGSAVVIIALGHKMRAARMRFEKSQEAAIQGYAILRALRDNTDKIYDFTIEYVNPRGAALAKQTPEAVMGHRLTEVLPGIVSAGVLASFCDVARTGAPLETEVRYEQDGLVGWFRNMVVKVGDGVAISYFDVTRAKQMEHELARRANQLERADVNRSQFLATLSHELRNPLAPLRNGLAVLRRRETGESADLVNMMDRQLTQLVRLVDDLLDVSRIDRGKIALQRERVKVDSVVSAAIETARPNIDAKGHELVVRFAARTLRVEGDPVRLAQIVSNLLINAAKFTPPKGRIELAMHAENDEVQISVRDNGVGIDAEHLSRVFELFVQVDSGQDGGGGLGLGLALVKSLAELHKGRVEARSAGLGKGAEFIIRLPLADTQADATVPRIKPTSVAGGRRILIVDDNADGAQTMGELLGAQGHDVRVFVDPIEALRAALTDPPEIAFLDINMPGMDGFTLAQKLRESPRGRSMRLIAITGMGRVADIERTREAGFDAHLTKPADPEKIIAFASADPADIHTVLPFLRPKSSRD